MSFMLLLLSLLLLQLLLLVVLNKLNFCKLTPGLELGFFSVPGALSILSPPREPRLLPVAFEILLAFSFDWSDCILI